MFAALKKKEQLLVFYHNDTYRTVEAVACPKTAVSNGKGKIGK